mgnify:CR=1 FL=1
MNCSSRSSWSISCYISDKTVRINKHTTVASVHQVDIVENDKAMSDLISSELPVHLQSLFDRSCEMLSEKEESQFLDLLIQ